MTLQDQLKKGRATEKFLISVAVSFVLSSHIFDGSPRALQTSIHGEKIPSWDDSLGLDVSLHLVGLLRKFTATFKS